MGWWSTSIMGGDTPLDFEDDFFDICKVEKFPEGGGMASLTKEDIANHLDELLEAVHKWKSEQNIGYQVLAVTMLKAGAFISGDLRDLPPSTSTVVPRYAIFRDICRRYSR